MEIYRLFSSVVAVIMMLLIKQQLDNNARLPEAMRGRRCHKKAAIFLEAETHHTFVSRWSACLERTEPVRNLFHHLDGTIFLYIYVSKGLYYPSATILNFIQFGILNLFQWVY